MGNEQDPLSLEFLRQSPSFAADQASQKFKTIREFNFTQPSIKFSKLTPKASRLTLLTLWH
jgi:hypothetical protein